MGLFKYGYRQDPRFQVDAQGNSVDLVAQDKSFAAHLAPHLGVSSPGDVDLRSYCLTANQGSLQSCVGNATAQSVYILNAVEGLPRVELSRLFVYNLARNEEPSSDGTGTSLRADQGTYIRLAFDVLSRFGICTEAIWPYAPEQVYSLPTILAMREATGHKIHSYYRIKDEDNDRLAQILTALRGNHPVVFGTEVDDAFEQLQAGQIAQVPKGPTVGGHALCIVGYNQAKDAFIVKNSWGSGWADSGFCYMSSEYIAWNKTTDIWVPTLGTVFQAKVA